MTAPDIQAVRRTPAPTEPPEQGRIDEPVLDERNRATAIVDGTGRVRAVSGAFSAVLRIRRDELLSQPLPSAVLAEDRPALARALRAVAEGEWPGCALEVRVLQHGRAERAIGLLLAADSPQRVRVQATDLTEEREALRALQESEESLRALTAHALDIWAVLDGAGRLRSVSDSVSAHLGWTAAELAGRSLLEYVHHEDVPRVEELLRALRTDPAAVRHALLRTRHKDGEWRTLETTTSGLHPAGLEGGVFVLNAREVTARERTDPTLREVDHRFGRLVEQALTGIAVLREDRIVYANPRLLQLAGLPAATLEGRPSWLRLLTRDSAREVRRARAAITRGSPHTARVRLRPPRPGGRPTEAEVACSIVEWAGEPALLCTVTDMTEAQALQARMAEAEKVEAVGLLAGGVAHDFNNMLTGILAWLDIASDELGPGNPVSHALDEARATAERAAELTRQLLAFGRRQRLDPGPLDLGEVVVRLKRWMDRVLGPAHSLVVDVPDAPWLIEADRSQIERAITALVMNAQDAMPRGGTIRVAVAHETLDMARARAIGPLAPGAHVVVRVRDEGSGMDDATRRRIFEPFFTTKPQGRGTGLGLPAVLGTVLQSGGAIEVDSAPGAGTEFRLFFPRRPASKDRAVPARRPAARGGTVQRRVLVIDDDPEVGRLLRRTLQSAGYAVRLAGSADEARSELGKEGADVLVCDLGLPGINGAELAGELCRGDLARCTVLISGRPITDEESARAGPFTLALEKPFRSAELVRAVAEVAEQAGLPAPS